MLRLGYDIGGMSVRACLLDDQSMRVAAHASRPYPLGRDANALVEIMEQLAREVLEPAGLVPEEVGSVGVGIPGTVRRDEGVLVSACNLNLRNVPVAALLQERFVRARICLANDADAAALAEARVGALRGYDCAMLITIGTGIGGGLIMDNRIFQGGRKIGCELGHITIQQGGPMCTCGNRGCAEALCSATWLEREGRHCVLDHPTSRIAVLAQGRVEKVTARDVIEAARQGDGIAAQIFDAYIDNLASLIATCCYLLGTPVVGIGGGVSNAGEFLLRPLEERVKRRARAYAPDRIVAAALGGDAGMIGAAMLPAVEQISSTKGMHV